MAVGRGPANGGTRYSLLSICDLCALDKQVQIASACQHGGTRRVLAQWSWRSTAGRVSSLAHANV